MLTLILRPFIDLTHIHISNFCLSCIYIISYSIISYFVLRYYNWKDNDCEDSKGVEKSDSLADSISIPSYVICTIVAWQDTNHL